jgi:hypothetical protein
MGRSREGPFGSAARGGLATYVTGAASVAVPGQLYQIANQDNWGFRMRWHRDILP